MIRRKSENMRFDKGFYTENGNWELCHHTGYEVKFDGDLVWWGEFVDMEGNLYYGNQYFPWIERIKNDMIR